MNILETAPISIVRRNHGIEHATVHILTARDPRTRLIGRADTTGYNIYGDVPTDALISAAREALERLQRGERALAVHPRCGTNLVVAGLLTALAAVLAMGRRPSLKKIPDAILATTIAAFLAQPLGMTLQARVTTSPDAIGARIAGVRQSQMGQIQVQHVDIEWD
ncbi:MAG: hypothetical protein KGJ80_15670 [Chloroflexota bacterium]|nr:hypothetical protein [Chloroflexota bacterium]